MVLTITTLHESGNLLSMYDLSLGHGIRNLNTDYGSAMSEITKMAGVLQAETSWFSVTIEERGQCKFRELCQLQLEEVLANVFSNLRLGRDNDSVQFEVFVGSSSERLDVKLPNYAKVRVPFDFGYKFIKFKLYGDVEPIGSSQTTKVSAFDIMEKARRCESHLPPERNGPNSNDRFYNDMLRILRTHLGVGFRLDQVETLGKKITKALYDCLWYMEPHHQKLSDRGIHFPKAFESLNGYYNYRAAHKACPKISAEILKQHIDGLSDVLLLTYTAKNQKFFDAVEELVESLKKYHIVLMKQQVRSQDCHNSSEPLRAKENNFALKIIPAVACPKRVQEQYTELEAELEKKNYYEAVWLNDFPTIPSDRYERRHWINDICLSFPLQIYSYEHGNNFGTYRFVWKVPLCPEERSAEDVLKIVAEIHKSLSSYHTRAMKKHFFHRYGKLVTLNKCVLRDMYRYLTDSELPDTAASEQIDARLRFVLQSDDPDILWDLRRQNGNPGSSKFNAFWDETNRYFEENTPAVQERRHGQHLYLPFAVSVEELVSTISARLPQDTPIPSNEWVRLQFWPSDPTTRRALHHTGRLNIKFAVQARQMRGSHEDSQYCYQQLKLLKEYAIHWREDALFFWLDDKAIVPIGEPDKPISATPRSHNKSLAPSTGPKLDALDHDFHLCGAIPSAVLKSDIPESQSETFFRGDVYVTVKDKVFEPSNTWRHGAEMVKLVREKYSEDLVSASVPIVLHYTDGGPDHRTTYTSVQLSSVAQFILLDLDLFAAVRTAPMGSWANLAERVNSLLNLGLQHVSLARETMAEGLESSMSRAKSLKDIRRIADKNSSFKAGLEASVSPVLQTIAGRFSRLKLKGEQFQVLSPATTEQVDDFFKTLHILEDKLEQTKVTKKDVEKCERLVEFFERHCHARHYMFQVKKCPMDMVESCWYCSLNPPRLSLEKYSDLHLIPDPVCSGQNQQEYLPFTSVYGTTTDDTDRPSRKNATVTSVRDIKHKSLLVGTKVRGRIVCGECHKPRVIYSAKKLSFVESTCVERRRQENTYTCGAPLFLETSEFYDSIVVRESLRCNSQVEVAYYSGKTCKFAEVCIYCGVQDDLAIDSDIQDLKRSFTTVRPICVACKSKGNEPVCRCPKNVGKKQKTK